MAPPSNSSDRRATFLAAVKNQKLDAVRWALLHGGQRVDTRDDDGYTALHLASASNKPKALQLMLDVCRRSRETELIDLPDGDGAEMTALMMAAANGHEACVRELLYAGAQPGRVCAAGLTAEAWARKRGHAALAALIARNGEDSSGEEEGGDDGAEGAPEGETSTQRSRRKKREMAAFESRGAKLAQAEAAGGEEGGDEEPGAGAAAAAAAAAAGPAPPPPSPRWPEVARALETQPRELAIERPGEAAPGAAAPGPAAGAADAGAPGGDVDPALWRCASVNRLALRLSGPSFPLRSLPAGVGLLAGLRTLVLSSNALTSLPDALCDLVGLKVLEAAHNALASLPPRFGQLIGLETLLLAHNRLADASPLAGCASLVSLNLDANALTSLGPAKLGAKPRLACLSASHNALSALPHELGAGCPLLAEVRAAHNALADLPYELCLLKKLRELDVGCNPLADPKLRKMRDKQPAAFLKELVPFLKKRGPQAHTPEPAPAAAAAPPPPPPPPPPAAAAAAAGAEADDGEENEEEEEEGPPAAAAAAPAAASARGASKKERAKAERKAAEERQRAAHAAAAARLAHETAAAEAAAAAGAGAGAEAGGGGGGGDGDGGDGDGDDDEAPASRRKAAPAAGFAYSLSPDERLRLERAEAARLAARRSAEAEAAAAAARGAAARDADEADRRAARAAFRDAQAEGGVAWAFAGGALTRVPASQLAAGGLPAGSTFSRRPAPKAGPDGGSAPVYELVCELPTLLVGRIIGKGGATIREVCARSKAAISIDAALNAPGQSLLRASGRAEALESARTLVNNALAKGGAR